MAIFTDEQLEILKSKRDSEGKILIDDSMPEDLKQAISFVNEHNIDLFNNNIDQVTPEELADVEEEVDPDFSIGVDDANSDDDEFSPIEKIDLLDIDDNISEDELDDLNEFI
ncbi:hypothetical protein IKE96_00285 [bacterium]|nr:hypothetical protein [bacterium]